MPRIEINWERAESVFGILLAALEEKRFPYDGAQPPQRPENMPKSLVWGSVEHSRFLWCVCYYMRGGIESETAILALGRLYQDHPEIFRPNFFAHAVDPKAEGQKVTELLRSCGLNYNSIQVGRHWVDNFLKLERFWEGDPANLFKNVSSYEELCRRIINGRDRHESSRDGHGFHGFREKMVSMIIHFLMDAGIISEFVFPVPVDFHVLRVLVANELLTAPDSATGDNLYGSELQAAARQLTAEYCKKHAVKTLRLGDALWLLSGSTCHLHPGNQVKIGNRDGRKTELTPLAVTWNASQTERFLRGCHRCPVASTCKHNVPSAHYYVRGELVILRPRNFPPQGFLF